MLILEKINKIQLATNETIKNMMEHQKQQGKMYRNMMFALLVGFILNTCILVGGVLYFFSAYSVEVVDTVNEITVEGESATYNGVIGDNSNVTVGSDE